jgi:hypothetical protein
MAKGGAIWPEGRSGPGTRRAAASRALGTVLRDPVIGILLLAGVAEILAGDPLVDWLVLLLTAAALGWDRMGRRWPASGQAVGAPTAHSMLGRGRPPVPAGGEAAAQPGPGRVDRLVPARLTLAVVIGGLVYAAVAGGLDPFSWPAMVAVAAPGLVGVMNAWRASPRPSAEAAPIQVGGAAAWVAVLVVLALWELSALLLQPSLTTGSPLHPTVSVLLDPALGSHLGRSVGFAVWLALGWLLVHR